MPGKPNLEPKSNRCMLGGCPGLRPSRDQLVPPFVFFWLTPRVILPDYVSAPANTSELSIQFASIFNLDKASKLPLCFANAYYRKTTARSRY